VSVPQPRGERSRCSPLPRKEGRRRAGTQGSYIPSTGKYIDGYECTTQDTAGQWWILTVFVGYCGSLLHR
jgi:hypothetical protein